MQIQPQVALSTGFKQWLDEVTTGRYVTQGTPLDGGFASSLRRTGKIALHLLSIRQTGVTIPPKTKTSSQPASDLKSMGLMTGSSTAAVLTPLGDAVLDRWESLGVADEDEDFEIARCGILLTEALQRGIESYESAYSFWCRLVSIKPADYWLGLGKWGLFAPSYLNWTASNGYNTFDILMAATSGDLPEPSEWEAWAASDSTVQVNLTKLLTTLDSQRTIGRLPYCQAMELYRLTRTTPDLVPSTLIGWNVANV